MVSYFSVAPFLPTPNPTPTLTSPVACLAWESSSTLFKTEHDSDPSGQRVTQVLASTVCLP